MLKFIILRIVWCIWCLFLDFLSSRNEGFICGTFVNFFHAALLCIAKERAFVLTNPLFSNRKHHVDSFPATVNNNNNNNISIFLQVYLVS